MLIPHLADDHLDIATLKHLYSAQPHGTLHFFLPLGNKSWMEKTIGVKSSEVTELDWWEERVVRLGEKETGAEGEGEGEKLRVVCTPCQHVRAASTFSRLRSLMRSVAQFTGRSLTDVSTHLRDPLSRRVSDPCVLSLAAQRHPLGLLVHRKQHRRQDLVRRFVLPSPPSQFCS